jgi:hypothetical protein
VAQAFDRVWHTGLLFKLKNILHPQLFILIRSFLKNRQFFVQIGEKKSTLGNIKAGVPQGSVLGPHLYLLFTSDLPQLIGGFSGTFADDTTFLFSDRNATVASNALQSHLNAIEAWSNKWKIKINTGKCQHITFTLNRSNCPPISFSGTTVDHTDTVKYLGIHLDRRLTFAHHIKLKRKELDIKRKKIYYIINKNSPLSLKNKVLIYKVMFKPVWAYCLPIWGLASNSNIEKIQKFQNIYIRVITGALNYISNEDLHKDLVIPTVQEEIRNYSKKHKERLDNHTNLLANRINYPNNSRLKKKLFVHLL